VERQRPRVLLVDDDADLRLAVAEALEERGYEVALAAGGQEALQRLRAGPRPCAVLLDLLMPGMDGAEFLAAMRADAALADLPVIILTGVASSKLKGLLGAQACLVKPFETAELCVEIDRACFASALA
jgi:CheY-like chemotaxis protein